MSTSNGTPLPLPDQGGGPAPKLVEGAFTSLPEYCRAWRMLAGLTQGHIADRVGVDKSNVSRFERGKLKSNKILSGYAGYGMPLPYDLVVDYIERG